ncbi:endonuclease/exonuclease/phosphatase family protein [Trichloromonas sp.]|uniref:endonuclease/exonuclease/phosphatase family protein n=1 Tax=Trichloromonas sp. TaxID=3069249 RepID=UPI002A4CF900|nr:hypothetical protein [Trichloromonas sp.]
MTYSVGQCRGADGRVDPERIAAVIDEGRPDLLALQNLETETLPDQLDHLARQLGMRAYRAPQASGSGWLAHLPLKGIQGYDLGAGGSVLRADLDLDGKRLHLLNLKLTAGHQARQRQIAALVGPDLLGDRSLTCATLLLGDFADTFWGAGNLALSLHLKKAVGSLWRGTYPATLPLIDRDRAYYRGHLRIIATRILKNAAARQACRHLPLIVTCEITDPRTFLRAEKLERSRMEVAPG